MSMRFEHDMSLREIAAVTGLQPFQVEYLLSAAVRACTKDST